MTAFYSLVERDIRLAYRSRSEWLEPLIFFLILVSLYPLALTPEPLLLHSLAPGILWVTLLLVNLLSLDRLFRSDWIDGSLEQLLLSPYPLLYVIYAKVLAHWLIYGVPMVLISPLIALVFNLDTVALKVLLMSLLLGTPILTLLGAIAVALTLRLPRGGLLLPLLVLPWYMPTLIFAAGALANANQGLPFQGPLAWLSVLLLLTLCLAPLAIMGALRISME